MSVGRNRSIASEPDGRLTARSQSPPLAGAAAAVRVLFIVLGGAALVGAVVLTPHFADVHLSRTGHIAETGYVVALRWILAGLGAVALALAAAAGAKTLLGVVVASSATVATLLTVEGGMRLMEWRSAAAPARPTGLRASAVPELYYENTPNFVEGGVLTFNSLGMRDEERVFHPESGSIVVVGDSIESWRAVPVLDMYPRRLEVMLDGTAGADAAQVVNLAVTGYSLHQKRLMLTHRALAWNPKLVVVGYCLNDPIPAWELVNHFTGRPQRRLWRTVDFVRTRVKNLLHGYGVDFYTAVHQPDSDSWRGVVTDLEALGRLARARDLPIVLVIFPLMVDTPGSYPWRAIHRRLTDTAVANGLHVVDLLADYEQAGFAQVRDDTVHPNAAGHRIAAQRLHELIVTQGLLPPPQAGL
jgi:lysophospholipase L1-like esterase